MQQQWTNDRRVPSCYTPPLGLRGLPTNLDGLDELVEQLCERLISAGPAGLQTARLVGELGLSSPRALRLLVAHARMVHNIGQVIGVPGDGRYCWADAAPKMAAKMTKYHRHMGRCYLAISARMKGCGVAGETVQLVLDFMARPDAQDDRHDELAALVASEGSSLADVVNGLLAAMRQTDEGRAALVRIGQQHADVLVPRRSYDQAIAALDAARDALANAGLTKDQPADNRLLPVRPM